MTLHSTGLLYRAEEVRQLDELARRNIPGYELMQRAGQAVFELICREYPGLGTANTRVLVLCGGGNNGGDGYVVASLLHLAGYTVDLLPLVPIEKLQGDARQAALAWQACRESNIRLEQLDIGCYGLIVDALLGTGLQRPITGDYAVVIQSINQAVCPVIAVDIPSGLHADTGQPMNTAVHAQHTLTFIGRKRGLYTGRAADYCGYIHFNDLAVPAELYTQVQTSAFLLEAAAVLPLIPRRRPSAHKGEFGHVLIVGGDIGMGGAAQMAAMAALRCGAGLVTAATRTTHAAVLNLKQPEFMSYPVEQPSELKPLLKRATVIALGPGLGRATWGQKLWNAALNSDLPLVLDADGLNLLAVKPCVRGNWILTPHPGEAARLLNVETAEIEADRYAAVRELATRYSAVVVLKGAGSMIAANTDSQTGVCRHGHSGMATGGMGDILTGLIAGLIAQKMPLLAAAQAAVCLHARAAELAAFEDGERGLLATDVLPEVRRLLNHVVV